MIREGMRRNRDRLRDLPLNKEIFHEYRVATELETLNPESLWPIANALSISRLA